MRVIGAYAHLSHIIAGGRRAVVEQVVAAGIACGCGSSPQLSSDLFGGHCRSQQHPQPHSEPAPRAGKARFRSCARLSRRASLRWLASTTGRRSSPRTESGNRQGSRFLCRMCGVCCHSDTNAAKNILFVHEADVKLHASVPCSPASRRKAPGGQAAVNQPRDGISHQTLGSDAISLATMRQALSLAASHQPCAGGN